MIHVYTKHRSEKQLKWVKIFLRKPHTAQLVVDELRPAQDDPFPAANIDIHTSRIIYSRRLLEEAGHWTTYESLEKYFVNLVFASKQLHGMTIPFRSRLLAFPSTSMV